MKRSLRSRNSCLPIQNIFQKQTSCEFSDLVQRIPEEILKKLPKRKYIICQDLLNIEFGNKPNRNELQKMRSASNLLRQKNIELGTYIGEVEQKPTLNQQNYIDCLLNQEDFVRKSMKCEAFSFQNVVNGKNKIEFKVQQDFDKDQLHYQMNQNIISYYQKVVQDEDCMQRVSSNGFNRHFEQDREK